MLEETTSIEEQKITLTNFQLFIILVGISIGIGLLSSMFLISDNLYYNSFAEQLTNEKIEQIIEQSHKWAWLSYVAIPIIYAIKFFLIAIILLAGCFLFDLKVSFSTIFKAVLLAETSFLIVPIIKLFWFLFIQTDYTINDLQYFYPLSALQLFDVKTLATWQIYPLQVINLFELIYWLSLAFWIKYFLKLSINKSMEIVVASYGTSLLLWIVIVTFLSLNMG